MAEQYKNPPLATVGLRPKHLGYVFAFLAVASLTGSLLADERRAEEKNDSAKMQRETRSRENRLIRLLSVLLRTRVKISEDTTRILGPLTDDGFIDYAAAINERARRGITPETNAIIPILQAFGPEAIWEEDRDEYFKLLGAPCPAEKGDYFISLYDYVKSIDDKRDAGSCEDDLREKATRRPWSEKEFPVLADWLRANEKPLNSLTKGVRRPQFYSPVMMTVQRSEIWRVVIPSDQMLYETPIDYWRLLDVRHALIARVMLKSRSGKANEAWQDLLTCFRLGRRFADGPTTTCTLSGMAATNDAFQATVDLAHQGKLTAGQARAYLTDMRKFAPARRLADRIDTAGRFRALGVAETASRYGICRTLNIPRDRSWLWVMTRITDNVTTPCVDWNELLRNMNSFYDNSVNAFKPPTCRARMEAADKVYEEYRQYRQNFERAKRIIRSTNLTQPWLGRVLSLPRNMTLATTAIFGVILTTSPCYEVHREDETIIRYRLTQIALALAAYRSDHKRYPESLSKLRPRYLAQVPSDPFAKVKANAPPAPVPYRYKLQGKRYILYSVGPDGKDDQGFNPDYRDFENEDFPSDDRDAEWDDIPMRPYSVSDRSPER